MGRGSSCFGGILVYEVVPRYLGDRRLIAYQFLKLSTGSYLLISGTGTLFLLEYHRRLLFPDHLDPCTRTSYHLETLEMSPPCSFQLNY